MTRSTAFIVLAMLLLLGWAGQALDDHSADYYQAADLEDARLQAAHQAQHNARLQLLCGPNAAYMELQDGQIQCTTKHATPTRRVQLTARATP